MIMKMEIATISNFRSIYNTSLFIFLIAVVHKNVKKIFYSLSVNLCTIVKLLLNMKMSIFTFDGEMKQSSILP